MEKIFVSVAETCVVLGLGKTKVHELIKAGRLRTKKEGRKTLVYVESIRQYGEPPRRTPENKMMGFVLPY
jgi:excisionase family DNA binding protein